MHAIISSFIHPRKALDIQPTIMAGWSSVKGWIVSVINKPGLAAIALTAGTAFGVSTAWIIDRFFQRSRKQLVGDEYYCHDEFREKYLSKIDQLSPQEKNLKNRLRTIFAATLLVPGAIAVAAWKISAFEQNYLTPSSLATGTIGFALGTKILEYYNKNSDQRIKEFVNDISRNTLITLTFCLDLSPYCDYLRYLNANKLAIKIQEKFKDNYGLILRGCRLTDSDLKRLKEADWFSSFEKINISDNPQLTATGLKCIGEVKAKGGTYCLTLNRIDLTDDDLIQMAESGYFNKLMELRIRGNPRITGKGLIRIAESGFENLRELDIGDNPQLLGSDVIEWVKKATFKKLWNLGLSNCNITENDLQYMIDEAEWFRNLFGLDLDSNTTLHKFPSNISKMAQLSERGMSDMTDGRTTNLRPFDGNGLFFRNYSKEFITTPEITALYRARKVVMILPPTSK